MENFNENIIGDINQMANIPYDKKRKKYCARCGEWHYPKEDFRCPICNYRMRRLPRSTNLGPNSTRRIMVDILAKRYRCDNDSKDLYETYM